MEMRIVLLPTDFSKDAEDACHQGCALAARKHARVLLLHVLRTDAFQDVPLNMRELLEREMRTEAEHRLKLLAASQEVPVDTLVHWGNPAATICRVAAEQGVELIIMHTHGRTGLAHLFLKSVAEQVIRHAPCAVLILPRAQASERSPKNLHLAHRISLLSL